MIARRYFLAASAACALSAPAWAEQTANWGSVATKAGISAFA